MNALHTTRTRYRALTLLCLAAAIAYICRSCVVVAESTIRQELHLTKSDTGWMMSIFYLVYGLGQIPASSASMAIGNRRALPIIATLWSFATALMSLAMALPVLILSRVLNGFAQAGIFPNTTVIVARWFPKSQIGLASGIIASSMSIGAAIGSAVMGALMVFTSWRVGLALFSILGVLWAAVFAIWFRNRPQDHDDVSDNELALIEHERSEPADSEAQPPTPWRRLLLSPATIWICGQQFFRAAGYIFFASWFSTYLQEARDVARSTSGILNSLPLLAVVGGCWLGGLVSDLILRRTGSVDVARKQMATVCMLLCAGFTLLAFFVEDPVIATLLISAGTLCAATGGPCAYAITIDLGGRHVASLFSTMNMVGNLGAFAFVQGVGYFLDWSDLNESVRRLGEFALIQTEGFALSTTANVWENFGWNAVFITFVMMYLMAALCWFMLRTDQPAIEQSFGRRRETAS